MNFLLLLQFIFNCTTIFKQNTNNIQTKLREGNVLFFQELYTLYYKKLCTYSLNYTDDINLAQDIVQDTFMYIWDNRKKIIITTSINGFLYKIVYNKIMDHYRGKKKTDKLLLTYYDAAIKKAVETNNDYQEQKLKKLEECIQLLPKRCKLIFLKKKKSRLKNKDIANDLNISIKTVEGHIARGYKFLKACISSQMNSTC
ncbi:MAG: RNA polymerase sigma-70 factor [Polaribacter sp.]|uniref:RNA polymerase sigma-70 factor n=1 Tax=Polaribacter sp. TaxID=1920175 RepID=UPI003265C35C